MPFLTKRPVWIAIQSIATSALLISASGIIYAQNSKTAKTTANAASVRTGEPVTLNFVNADIEAVARTMATITGRNVVVDPRVKGQLNLVAERPVSPHDAFQQFLAALRLQGFTVVDTAGLYKVVPEADAKLQGGSVSVAHLGKSGQFGNSGPAGGHIVTQIFKLNYETAGNLVPVLRPLISPNNTININPGTNALVITDYADNLQRLGKIIAAMDVSNASDVEIIPLHHAIATELAPLVARLIDGGGAPGGASSTPGQTDTSFKTTLLAEPRSNALILRAANPARVAQVRALVAKLDQAPAPGSANANGNIHVVYLKNADATALATTLRAAMAANGAGAAAASSPTTNFSNNASASNNSNGSNSSGTSFGAGMGIGASGASTSSTHSNQPSTGGQIQADPATNSLIITAPEPQYRQLRAVIDQLDGRRAQVLVESLIAEVNVEKTAQFGIQWQSLLGQNNNVIGIIGNNTSVGGANIFKLAQSLYAKDGKTMPSTGLNAGLAVKHNGDYVLGALANLLQTSGDGNVLSTPNLLTLDNEEAKILIGENVPFPTGSYANTGGSSSSVNPFTTVERKDVGLTLRVKPQINENGTVKLVIYQEISAVKGSVEESKNGPTTTKRSIESTVLVEDGSIIVLGGLLQDKYSGGQDKVPLLGDIPGVGALFRSDSRTRQKTNLMVFLRPVVLRSATASTQLSMDRYDLMRGLQQDAQPEPSNTMPINEGPLLPALVSSPSAGPLGSAAAAPAPTPASMQTDIPSWSSQ
jgi:general secretion pathway protein D